jgi:hypothetical protein
MGNPELALSATAGPNFGRLLRWITWRVACSLEAVLEIESERKTELEKK